MTQEVPLLGRVAALPPLFDRARASRVMDELKKAARAGAADVKQVLDSPAGRKLCAAVFANSAYLGRLALREPGRFARLVLGDPDREFDSLLARTRGAAQNARDGDELMAVLRAAKSEAALLIALSDIAGVWPLERVTEALTALADMSVGAALGFLLREEAQRGRINPPSRDHPEEGCGLFVLAMGKHGAGELNYSSDIDLIVFFDKALFPVASDVDGQAVAVAVVRGLVKILSETTSAGYVFRTDLRLRPDAGATQVALSTESAMLYYEASGQNWERAAMIKARPCAGDLVAGAAFMAELRPFVWRKHLDYAAIEDIHSIKRQIHVHRGHAKIAVAGHNIKLGRGGIREIEFFVQTQQLILGGRDSELRTRGTCETLQRLAEKKHIGAAAARDLTECYRFLRTVEHRLQMIEDAQTHTLPADPAELDHIARFCGFSRTSAFEQEMRTRLKTVEKHYAALFEGEAPLSEVHGNLVFTGVDDDPETLETLTRLGFKRASEVSAAIRAWHHGRPRAVRSERARELLTKLVPRLLRALAQTGDPDGAFVNFHRFLEGLPAGVQLFSLLANNPALLDTLTQLLGTAPRLSGYLARNAGVIDAMLDREFASQLPRPAALERSLAATIGETRDYQDILDAARRWTREQTFRVGFQVISGLADPLDAGPAHANVAEAIVRGLYSHVEREFSAQNGAVPRSALAVVAMGKLGGQEMTAVSDLDLIFVYDAPDDARARGPRELAASDYFTRLGQRMINALSAPTAEGKLYEVDMQLRPSGRAGPVAANLQAFEQYHREKAWTWEHMALTRARAIAGPEALRSATAGVIRSVLSAPRDHAKTARDIVDMRARLTKEYPSLDPFELKYVRGGLVDLEFITQFLLLVHAHKHPDLLTGNTLAALRRIQNAELISPAAVGELENAAMLIHTVLQILRVAVEGPFDPGRAAPALAALLCRATDHPSLSRLERNLVNAQREVHALFHHLVEAGG